MEESKPDAGERAVIAPQERPAKRAKRWVGKLQECATEEGLVQVVAPEAVASTQGAALAENPSS